MVRQASADPPMASDSYDNPSPGSSVDWDEYAMQMAPVSAEQLRETKSRFVLWKPYADQTGDAKSEGQAHRMRIVSLITPAASGAAACYAASTPRQRALLHRAPYMLDPVAVL